MVQKAVEWLLKVLLLYCKEVQNVGEQNYTIAQGYTAQFYCSVNGHVKSLPSFCAKSPRKQKKMLQDAGEKIGGTNDGCLNLSRPVNLLNGVCGNKLVRQKNGHFRQR